MPEFILLMQGDLEEPEGEWGGYLAELTRSGVLRGGSAIGAGMRFKKDQPVRGAEIPLTGFIRVECANLKEVERLLTGNPVYEAGGTVEIRHLPSDE